MMAPFVILKLLRLSCTAFIFSRWLLLHILNGIVFSASKRMILYQFQQQSAENIAFKCAVNVTFFSHNISFQPFEAPGMRTFPLFRWICYIGLGNYISCFECLTFSIIPVLISILFWFVCNSGHDLNTRSQYLVFRYRHDSNNIPVTVR